MGTESLENVDLDSMSQEDLVALEDEQVAAEEAGDNGEAAGEPAGKPNADDASLGDAVGDKGADDGAAQELLRQKGEDPPGNDPPDGDDAGDKASETPSAEDDEIQKHVSPPSKWAAQRVKNKELKQQLDEATQKAAKSDEMESELGELKEKLSWLESAMKSKGIDVPSEPMESFSEEKIAELREDHGDEIADMMQAAAAIMAKHAPAPAAKAEEKLPEDKPPEQDPPAPKQEQGPDPKLIEAVEDNDELSYWRENSPALWKRATAKDDELKADPEYLKLSYAERFTKVVENVKQDVTEGAKPKDGGKGGGDIPQSLSGSDGAAPTLSDKSALDKVLAADTLDKQLEIYNSLPEAQRDEVDLALDI